MVEDANGHFYFGTTNGVIEVDPATGDTWRYTTAEGLAQNEVLSALASRHGDIWFGTIVGVSRLDTTRPRPRTPAPRASITTVHVNGDARLVSELGEQEVSGLTLAPASGESPSTFSRSVSRWASACGTNTGSTAPKTNGARRRRSAASTTHISHRVRIVSWSAP